MRALLLIGALALSACTTPAPQYSAADDANCARLNAREYASCRHHLAAKRAAAEQAGEAR